MSIMLTEHLREADWPAWIMTEEDSNIMKDLGLVGGFDLWHKYYPSEYKDSLMMLRFTRLKGQTHEAKLIACMLQN